MSSSNFLDAWLGRPITTVVFMLIIATIIWVIRFLRYRRSFKTLHGSLKAPPFNFLLGTVPGMAQMMDITPADLAPAALMTELYRRHGLGPLFFLDNWPLSSVRQMVITEPSVAAQVTQSPNLPKDPIIRELLLHICGPRSLFFAEGAELKRTRTLFNPGFAVGHLMTLVPSIVDDVLIFCSIISKHAESGNAFPIEQALTRLTMDVMGHVILDHDLNSQTMENEFVEAFKKATAWTPSTIAVANINPFGPIMKWYYARRMNNYLMNIIDGRYNATNVQSRSVIDLALREYSLGVGSGNSKKSSGLDMAFKLNAIDQMKTFLLAGTSTTSSAVSYIYYLLDLHRDSLSKVRKEYDDVMGSDQSATAEVITRDPRLLNKLVYTTAVIKETLRLFPPATTARAGNSTITHDKKQYPTKGLMLWIGTNIIHRRADLFPSPDEFIPERFLPAPNNRQEIPKNAWRPFEKGPRACIGQELAMLEIKIIMALTLRQFEISGAYEEWDKKLGRPKPGEMLDGKRGAFGLRSYQVMADSAKPVDGMPVRVGKRI